MTSYHIAFDKQQIEVLAAVMKHAASLPADKRPIDVTDEYGNNVVNILSSMFNNEDLLANPAPMLHGFCF